MDNAVTFGEFAAFYDGQLTNEEQLEFWFSNEIHVATDIAVNFIENDDVTNDVGDGFSLGLGSSFLVSDASHSVERENPEGCEFGQCATQCGEVASESAAGTASSSTLDELRAAMNELHAAMLQISFVFPQPDARELHTVIDELHVVMLQISFRDRGIGTACA